MATDRKVARLYEDLVSEAFHTAFRKALDSSQATAVWRAISALPPEEWSVAIDWVLSTAAAPLEERAADQVERTMEAVWGAMDRAQTFADAKTLAASQRPRIAAEASRMMLAETERIARAVIEGTGIERSQAATDVLAERSRQVEAEGWTPEHDDKHRHGEMAVAAACYALNAADDRDGPEVRFVGAELWPWADEWWKPKDRRYDLVRAAALLLAEIERLDRVAIKGGDVG